MIDNEIILDIRNRSDIVDIIGNYLPLSKKGKNYFGVCPFHDDNNPSMSVSREKQIYTCFSCGATGNVITFVMDYEKVSYKEALQILASKLGIDLKIGETKKADSKQYQIYETLDKFYQNNLQTSFGKKAKDYLKTRNIDDEIIKEFGIGLSPNENDNATKLLTSKNYNANDLIELGITNRSDYGLNDVFVNRIMFPLWNEFGNTVGYSGRIYDKTDDAKYVNTKETSIFKKGLLLYNYHRAKEYVREEKCIIIMEGFMDVIRAYSIGIKNVVASMGTAVTADQAKLLKKLSNNVYLCFDGDMAGEKATLACGNELVKLDINPKIIRLADGDPDSYILKYGKEKFVEYLSSPMSFIDFKLEYYKKGLNLSNSVDATKYVKDLMPELNLIEDEVLLELTIKKISNIVNVSYDTIKSLLKKDQKEIKITKPVTKTAKNMMNKYEKAEKILIYYMLKSSDVIIKYRNSISYLPSVQYRYLFQEILGFYEKYKEINVADFITYLGNKKELIDAVGCVMEFNFDEEYKESEIPDCVKVIKDYAITKERDRLNQMLKEEIDLNKKAEIAQKMADLKLRSVEND